MGQQHGVLGKSITMPKIMPGVFHDSKVEKHFQKLTASEIEFLKIFENSYYVVFKVVTDCLFKPTEITLEILQKFSEKKIKYLPVCKVNMEKFEKKLKNVNFIFTVTENGTRSIMQKQGKIDNYVPNINVYNDDSQNNYFIMRS